MWRPLLDHWGDCVCQGLESAVTASQMREESEGLLAAARAAAQPASRSLGTPQPRGSIDFDNLWPAGGHSGGRPPPKVLHKSEMGSNPCDPCWHRCPTKGAMHFRKSLYH